MSRHKDFSIFIVTYLSVNLPPSFPVALTSSPFTLFCTAFFIAPYPIEHTDIPAVVPFASNYTIISFYRVIFISYLKNLSYC